MEPVDPRMGGLLGDPDPGVAGGPDELRTIITKAGRRMRLRAAAVAGAVAVAAGGGVGYAVSTTGGPGRQVIATSGNAAGGAVPSEAPSGASGASVGAPSYALPGTSKFTRLFTRQANGVDIRAFLVAYPILMTPLGATGGTSAPSCSTVSHLQAELSTADMVATVGGGFSGEQSSQPIVSAEPSIVGLAEGDPVAEVVVLTQPAVAKVRMTFTGGATDEMAPHEGWSVLAAPAPWFQSGKQASTTIGELTALDSSGGALASQTLTWPPVVTPAVGGAPGSVGSSGGSGSGTANSGTAKSGAAITGAAGSGTANTSSEAQVQAAAAAAAARAQADSAAAASAALQCVPPPLCSPPSTAAGAMYACPVPLPAPAVVPSRPTTTTSPAKGSGG